MTARRRIVVSGLLAAAMTLPGFAGAQTSTPEVLTHTIAALPSCIKWQPKGVCFWLRCSFTGCKVVTSFRVQHYVPDVIISTYHDPVQHPWRDIGRAVAVTSNVVGSAIMRVPLDSAGSSTKSAEQYQSRDADAIGNPIGMLANLAAGQPLPLTPSLIKIPNTSELAAFPSSLSSVGSMWAAVPSTIGGEVVAKAKSVANIPGQLAKLASLPSITSTISRVSTPLGSVGSLASRGMAIARDPTSITSVVDLGPVRRLVSMIGAGGFTSSAVFCPGSATPFGLHYQSTIDGLFWRGILPVEMIYPGSWIPGLAEVGGLPTTWGGVYPRTSDLVQVHGVKASAVLATRVLSIISQRAQPHLYAPLQADTGGFRYFETGGDVKWQRVYPFPSRSCGSFGGNDSLSLTSYGDGTTSGSEGYVWNAWRRYECCQRRGVFLRSVSW